MAAISISVEDSFAVDLLHEGCNFASSIVVTFVVPAVELMLLAAVGSARDVAVLGDEPRRAHSTLTTRPSPRAPHAACRPGALAPRSLDPCAQRGSTYTGRRWMDHHILAGLRAVLRGPHRRSPRLTAHSAGDVEPWLNEHACVPATFVRCLRSAVIRAVLTAHTRVLELSPAHHACRRVHTGILG